MTEDNIPMDEEFGYILLQIEGNKDMTQVILLLGSYMINVRKHPANRIAAMAYMDELINGKMEDSYCIHDLLIRSQMLTPHIFS